INAIEASLTGLSDDSLRAKTNELRERLTKGESLDDILPEAFAVVREAAKRTLNQRHYDVQLVGGIVLHQGNIAEMMTGEGKTLVATLPAYLNALEGKGVHIVTVNDYLSRRDAVWMGQIYAFLGLSVGVINHMSSFLYDVGHEEVDEERDELGAYKVKHEFLRECSRKEAYDADITYGTNNEFGFDYLRDNIAYEKEALVQGEYNFAIVDEIDSILIDEARTPLIISAPAQESEDLYTVFAKIAKQMKEEEDYTVDEKLKAISVTDAGITKAEKILGVGNIYTEKGIKYVHHMETAVKAKAIFKLDKEYVVRDGEIVIVDEFTGRLQPGRRWSEGLHQAVEAKEGVVIQKESRTLASITFQNYFKLYKKLAGMTGTAETSAEEFYKVYSLDVISIPTNKEKSRIDIGDYIFQTEEGKLKAIACTVKDLNEKGQPVLIGTASIEKNELVSAYLKKEGVVHEVRNAKNHENEGEVIAQAGVKGRVTIATNMAGRGVDIKLGGSPSTNESYKEVKALGGLFVLGTERHEARRIDDQLRGRSGRQGDAGTTQFFVSLEDSLMRVFASDAIKKMMGRFGIPEDQPIENKLITRSLESAQTKIEGFYFDARKSVLEYDNVMSKQRDYIYTLRRGILMGEREVIETFLNEAIEQDDVAEKVITGKREELGEEVFLEVTRRLILQNIDMFWMEHLEMMNYTRSSVNLRAYGQRDPLIEYKKEGSRLFAEMQQALKANVISLLPSVNINAFAKEEEKAKKVFEQARESGGEDKGDNKQVVASKPRKEDGTKVGRNDPCPCGSGKKYKKCGLINAPEHGA
ncbi:MAG TPA: preprotein translocase subunit SecA, partial [Candidatus Yonathbacteria bacterium]|nr:preprotein translocase subunit SecA [Candidatus Yonathbacteria bacterium]